MKYLLFLLLALPLFATAQSPPAELEGAWETTYLGPDGKTNQLAMIIEEGFFVMTAYNEADSAFIATLGGSYDADYDNFTVKYEFDSSDPANVGSTASMPYRLEGSILMFNDDKVWQRVDDGEGDLAGAWQFTGRKENGEMRRREPTGPRRTMKFLSGERFQWVAFNMETGEFMGTGGGTYSADNNMYIEKIEFFSRDSSRVGNQLSFDYKIRNNEWHHMGLSSKGDPMYETWGHRTK